MQYRVQFVSYLQQSRPLTECHPDMCCNRSQLTAAGIEMPELEVKPTAHFSIAADSLRFWQSALWFSHDKSTCQMATTPQHATQLSVAMWVVLPAAQADTFKWHLCCKSGTPLAALDGINKLGNWPPNPLALALGTNSDEYSGLKLFCKFKTADADKTEPTLVLLGTTLHFTV